MTVRPLREVPVADPGRDVVEDRSLLIAAVARVLDSGRFVLGPEHDAFLTELSHMVGVGHGVGAASGTDALTIALLAVGVEPGQSVAMTANAGGYATTAARAIGARALYVDVDPIGLQMSPADLEALLRAQRPAAVVLTHLYGDAAPTEQIVPMCRERGVPVVEDCAQALGLAVAGRAAGSWGDVSVFSFYPTKNLGAVGDGGAILTDSPEVATRARSLSQYGWTDKYRVELDKGRNSRLDELQAAMLRARLPFVAPRAAARRAHLGRLRASLPEAAGRFVTTEQGAVHLAVLLASDRDGLRRTLADRGVRSDVHYPVPDHQQPAWRDGTAGPLPVTEDACRRVVTVPCFSGLSSDELDLVCEALSALG